MKAHMRIAHPRKFKFDSRFANGHNHELLGYASGMIGLGSFHIPFLLHVSSYRNPTFVLLRHPGTCPED